MEEFKKVARRVAIEYTRRRMRRNTKPDLLHILVSEELASLGFLDPSDIASVKKDVMQEAERLLIGSKRGGNKNLTEK